MLKKIILVCCFLLFSCQTGSSPPKNTFLVSLPPYYSLVSEIAGPDYFVQVVVPDGANPHSFEPTFQQMSSLRNAQLWFSIGEPFEKKLIPLLKKQNPQLEVIDLRSSLSLLSQNSPCCSLEAKDRHIWLSPSQLKKQTALVAKALSEHFPEDAKSFQENAASLEKKLDVLHENVQTLLKNAPKRSILASHSAFGYFCHEYQLEQLSVEQEGKDPTPKDLKRILNQAEEINIILALPQYNNKSVRMISKQFQLPLYEIDPYARNYFDTIQTLAEWMAKPDAN